MVCAIVIVGWRISEYPLQCVVTDNKQLTNFQQALRLTVGQHGRQVLNFLFLNKYRH
jgi:hypothetical protein